MALAPISKTLEITVISAEDLRRHRKSIKNSSFATVKIDSQNVGRTQIDDRGGSYPHWNQKLALNLPSNVSSITVDVHCGSFSKNRVVGTAKVPVSDFLGGLVPESYLHFLSYRLRDVRGERNGIVNISVRVLVPDVAFARKVQVPAEKTKFGGGGGGGGGGGVVIGIPVWSGRRI